MEMKIVVNKKDLTEIIKSNDYVTILYRLSNNPNTKFNELELQDFEYECYGMTLVECHYAKVYKTTSKNPRDFPYFEFYINGKKIKNQYNKRGIDWIKDSYNQKLNFNKRV